MHRATRVRLTLFLAVMAWLMVLPSAQAYIDPASSSFIFQGIIAGIAAAGTGLAVFWTRIKALFRRGDRDAETEAEHSPEQV